jgi:hypothetical protein
MNEAMKKAWLEIDQMLGEPTREELDVFLRTWQRAIQAEREECAKLCDGWDFVPGGHEFTPQQLTKNLTDTIATRIRARGQA